MIGARISARRPSPRAALWLAGTGLVLGALGVAAGVATLVPLAVAPIAFAIALVVVRERGFQARFTPVAMDVARPRQTIPYSSLLEVRPLVAADRPRPDSFAIQVVHARGTLVIPGRLTHSSERVYAFLRGALVPRPVALPAAIEAYRAEQEDRFGREKVFSYVGRCGGDQPRARNLRPIGVGLLATATIWAAIPFGRGDEPGWWLAAAVMAVLGAALLLRDFELQRRETSGPKAADTTAALVIAPLGLAVQQGALSGHLAWEEIRKVHVRSGRATVTWSRAQAQPGIVLEVEGASIVLSDSYDRPLSEIHGRILRYWR